MGSHSLVGQKKLGYIEVSAISLFFLGRFWSKKDIRPHHYCDANTTCNSVNTKKTVGNKKTIATGEYF